MVAKRLILTGLALMLACGVAITKPNTALAWAGDLPDCDFGTFNPVTAWDDHYDTDVDSNAHALSSTSSFVVYQQSDAIYVVVSDFNDGSNQVRFTVNPTAPTVNRMIVWSNSVMRFDSTSHDFIDYTQPGNIVGTAATCLKWVNHADYTDATYTGTTSYPSYDFDNPPSESPSPSPTPSDSPSPSPTPSPATTYMTEDEATKFAQKLGIILAFSIGAWIIYQFRFTRHE